MTRLFYLVVVSSLAFNADCLELFDTKTEINNCIRTLQVEKTVFCQFELSKSYQPSNKVLSRQQAANIQDRYSYFIHHSLNSEDEQLDFSNEVLDFLVSKGMIKPFMIVNTHKTNPQLQLVIPINGKDKGGYGITLSFNNTQTLRLLNQFTQANKTPSAIYNQEIQEIFATE